MADGEQESSAPVRFKGVRPKAFAPVAISRPVAIESIDGPWATWMDQRTQPSLKASIEAAADRMGDRGLRRCGDGGP
jgi:hypothetical protein